MRTREEVFEALNVVKEFCKQKDDCEWCEFSNWCTKCTKAGQEPEEWVIEYD